MLEIYKDISTVVFTLFLIWTLFTFIRATIKGYKDAAKKRKENENNGN